jgi:hypothetical protein
VPKKVNTLRQQTEAKWVSGSRRKYMPLSEQGFFVFVYRFFSLTSMNPTTAFSMDGSHSISSNSIHVSYNINNEQEPPTFGEGLDLPGFGGDHLHGSAGRLTPRTANAITVGELSSDGRSRLQSYCDMLGNQYSLRPKQYADLHSILQVNILVVPIIFSIKYFADEIRLPDLDLYDRRSASSRSFPAMLAISSYQQPGSCENRLQQVH